ncbi:MAG: N-acetyltransferase [Anaerolineales bacterium]|nr:N-acetyltransferase [Anaerolineales bacterium]
MNVRQAAITDAPAITRIYNWYILNTIISFEMTPLSIEEIQTRIQVKLEYYDWLVGETDHEIIGYAYYGAFRPREAYHHTVESTIYIAQKYTGQGYGKPLYEQLIESARKHGFREMVAIIALPNPVSVSLHQKLGFELVGVNKGVGYKMGRYIDVGMWQLSLYNS